MEILEKYELADEDSLRMIQYHITETTATIKIGNEIARERFSTKLGVPQGDSLSPILFLIYLEHILREAGHREILMELNDMEIAYADDVNFLTLDHTLTHDPTTNCRCAECRSAKILEQIDPVFTKYNMKLNRDKTTIDIMTSGSSESTEASTVGTHINTATELKLRKQKANTAFINLYRIWNLCSKTKTKTKLRFYNACVIPIITYNIGSIPFKKGQLRELDKLHRRHLRIIRGERYGSDNFSTNEEIYERMQTCAISVLAVKRRWQLLGHILRRDKETPANVSMEKYYKKQVGENRHEITARSQQLTTLPNLIHSDIKTLRASQRNQYFNTEQIRTGADLDLLRRAAGNRKKWQEGTAEITRMARETWQEEEERLTKKYGIFGHP